MASFWIILRHDETSESFWIDLASDLTKCIVRTTSNTSVKKQKNKNIVSNKKKNHDICSVDECKWNISYYKAFCCPSFDTIANHRRHLLYRPNGVQVLPQEWLCVWQINAFMHKDLLYMMTQISLFVFTPHIFVGIPQMKPNHPVTQVWIFSIQ